MTGLAMIGSACCRNCWRGKDGDGHANIGDDGAAAAAGGICHHGSSRRHLTLQLLCKDTQKRSFDRLAVVCRKLEALREFPPVDSGQILLYEAESDPQFVTFESPGGMTIYTAVVYVYYYI